MSAYAKLPNITAAISIYVIVEVLSSLVDIKAQCLFRQVLPGTAVSAQGKKALVHQSPYYAKVWLGNSRVPRFKPSWMKWTNEADKEQNGETGLIK